MSTRYSAPPPSSPRVPSKAVRGTRATRERTARERIANDNVEHLNSISNNRASASAGYNVAAMISIEDESKNRPEVTSHWLNPALKARDLMKACEATLRPEDSIERAARLMSDTESGSIPVVDGYGRLLGIITGSDIARKLIAPGASIPHAQVSDCMTAEVFACSANNSLESCVSAMCWHQLRRIPVVDDEHRVLGTISQRDLAQYVCEHPERVESPTMVDILWALAS